MTVQLLILLLYTTQTPTTGGLQTVFNQAAFGLDPFTLLVLSITWSLTSCVRVHTKVIVAQKGFCKFSSQFFIFLWGLFATLRRMLSIVALFVPSLGLFSLLHHWRWEQIPFRIRLNFSKRPGFEIDPDDKIALLGLNETIFWSELDRWDYSGSGDPTPPPYSIYTLLTLKGTFIAGAVLCCAHFLFVLLAKVFTSEEFRRPEQFVNKFLHVLENLNLATPYSDWDEGYHSVEMFRKRFGATCREMIATFCVNIVSTGMCMVPLWYTGEEISFMAFRDKCFQI